MEKCQYCLSDKYKDVTLHMKTCPHKKRHMKDLKLGVKPIGYATCDECSKLAFTRWYSGYGTKYEKVDHTVCKEHDEALQKRCKENRERLGL